MGPGHCVTWGSREDANSPAWLGWGPVNGLQRSNRPVLTSHRSPLPTIAHRCVWLLHRAALGAQRDVSGIIGLRSGGPWDPQVPHRSSGAGWARQLCRAFRTRQSLLWPQSITRFLYSLPDTPHPCLGSTCHIFICSGSAFLIDCGLHEGGYHICLIL